MKHPLRKKEINSIYELLKLYRNKICVVREGMTEDEEDSYPCKDCPFNSHTNCLLKVWVHKKGLKI